MMSQSVQISDTMRFPKDYRENLAWRRSILLKAREDTVYRLKVKELFRRNILFAFNAFFYTYDPRKRPFHDRPFCTWDYQDEAILDLTEAIASGKDRVWEKSRDMGASWMGIGVHVWHWLKPIGGNDFLWGSRIEDYVDKKGDMRPMFPKARYLLYRLPGWLRPARFKPSRDDNYMKLINPESGNTISGESSNPNFSTGGRYAQILMDEFAKWEAATAAWTASGDASPSRFAVSTPNGAGGQFFEVATDGKTAKQRFHWSIHPEKSLGISCEWPPSNEAGRELVGENWKPQVALHSPWYDKECERRSTLEVAQELDINYLGAGNPVFEGIAWERLNELFNIDIQPTAWLAIDFKDRVAKDIPRPYDDTGIIRIYEQPKEGYFYAMGVDVVEGVEGGDYLILTVLDRETKSVVCSYYSQLDEVLGSRVCKIIYDLYNEPWTGIETPGPGLALFDFCVEDGMNNLFVSPRYDTTRGGVSYKKGWRNDASSRPELVASVKRWLIDRNGLCHIRAVREMMTFIKTKTGRPEHQAGCHDDEVFGLGIAIQVDELAPEERRKVDVQETRSDGLPMDFPRSMPILPEATIEEQCFIQAMASRSYKTEYDQFYNDMWGD